MPRLLLARIFLIAAGLSLPSLIPTSAQDTSASAEGTLTSVSYREGLEQQTFALVNQYRLAHHFPPLRWDGTIAKVARGHSQDMASGEVDFGHGGFMQRVSVLKTELIGLHGAGENVLRTNDPGNVAATAVNLWLHSPHHLANIRGDFNYSGMGIWVDDQGMIYFTQIFVKTEPPPAEEAQTAPPPGLMTPFGLIATPKTRSGP